MNLPRFAVVNLVWTAALILASPVARAAADGAHAGPHAAFEQILRRSRQELWAGQTQNAQIDARLAIGTEPGNPDGHVQLGMVLNALGDYVNSKPEIELARRLGATDEASLGPLFKAELALGENQALLDLYPDPGERDKSARAAIILRARALALRNLGRNDEALDAINRSLAIRRDVDGLMAASQVALARQNTALANSLADEALKLAPKNGDVVIARIDVALKSGDNARALYLAERMVAEKPGDPSAYLERINVYLALGMIDRARPEVDRVLHVASSGVATYFRAIILARTNKVKAAWAVAQSLSPEFIQSQAEIALNVANMAVDAGFLESGAGILSGALARNQSLIDARLVLADIRLRQNSTQGALNVLNLVADSKDPRVAVMYARVQLKRGRSDLAKTYIDRAISLGAGEELLTLGKDAALRALQDWLKNHAQDDRARGQYAMLLLKLGDARNARIQLELVARGTSAEPLPLMSLASLLEKDDPARALEVAERALKLAPDEPDFLDAVGQLRLNQGDGAGALTALNRAHQLKPDDPQVSYHFAMALGVNGRRAEAKAMLQGAVEQGGFAELDDAKALLAVWR